MQAYKDYALAGYPGFLVEEYATALQDKHLTRKGSLTRREMADALRDFTRSGRFGKRRTLCLTVQAALRSIRAEYT